MKKILIVGGVAGGATAAARLRRLNEEDKIIMFERDEYISFANCGLPYYLGGVIKQRDKLFVQTVEGMSERFNLDIRNFNEVTEINKAEKFVTVRNTQTNATYTESFDVLILSPGAKPIQPPIPGIKEATNLFVLRNIPDTDAIYNFIKDKQPKTAVVVGGGFIGVEMAENLVERGIKVTLVEKMPQVLAPLDFEMAQMVHQELNTHGVELVLGDGVSHFSDNGHTIHLESGKEVDTDLLILSIGVVPENGLAKNGGLQLGPRGHIATNPQLRTFDAVTGEVLNDIYAIGDAIQVKDVVTGGDTAIALAWPANRQGRIVADIINGYDAQYNGSLGTSVLKVFNLTVAATGNNQRLLEMKKIPYQAIHAHRGNHASYYPNATNIALKLLFNPETGEILGAQAVGQEGTEKRIDVIATAIKLKAKVTQLSDLELSYAPPFSSAKDPVNILGYIAENVLHKDYGVVYAQQVEQLAKEGAFLLDVRTPIEFSTGHFPGAVNIEVDELRQRIDEIKVSKDTPIYVNCQVGLRAYIAIRILKGLGFTKLFNVSGGYSTYKSFKYELSTAKKTVDTKVDEITGKSLNELKVVDVVGLQCPGPLMATYKAITEANEGDHIKIIATDPGFAKDVETWSVSNGHTLVSNVTEGNKYIAEIVKGHKDVNCTLGALTPNTQENATIVLFSGELDKALAAMIIAQGAAAQGKKVTIFYTFWGLNALRKPQNVATEKNLIEKMFGVMMPRGASKLPLSSMNMGGMGKAMIEGIMKTKGVDQLDVMMKNCLDLGVKFIACTMSMDLMGIKKEELIDGIEYGGVATYIASNENVGTTLFI
ncbi:MAG TPA: pyridine nucleotide-disulfide oxidoreductase [Erysipelotrichaceae bacterium]|nr:MAG: pyridine nucleotide-disulfide oxidoreductase [Firmicutes bacterium GWE2_51_13]HAO60390.1 pyridine nucleotide-disulfide oxidoreductase [Erysipelotrichaceae bacterium]HBZ41356.1 pyridine nucleotide-disulfide oxidoreductase [Erysipelotrichaceae bacterium]